MKKRDHLRLTRAIGSRPEESGREAGYFFFDEDFLRGTFPPAARASDNPIAMACFRFVTFLPERPLFKLPRFRSCIAFSTFCDAFLPYLAIHSSSKSFDVDIPGP